MRRGLGVLAGILLGLAAASQAWAADPSPTPGASWWTGYLAHSELVRLPDGRSINLYCEGKGGPVVVLDAGLGDGAWSWSQVQDQIAQRTRVCAYDRAGYGRSSPGPMPRDTAAIVGDLAAALKAAHVRGPYLLVGHSLASFDMRLFAFTHAKDVAGMVLVDPSADWQMRRMAEVAPRIVALNEAAYNGLRPCATSPRPPELAKLCALLPPGAPAEAKAYLTETRGPAYYQAMLAELDSFTKADNEELTAAKRSLSAKPLIVLTAGDLAVPGLSADEAAATHKVWSTMHDEIAGLSTRGVNRTVEGSSHYIHQIKPQVVIDAVFEVLDAARR
ncbi:MAG TPA: alpha/beta hydrolase, partial [Phenylobacterium sp.]|jgi:pimeloyl-ACP methyl ester carboxylesterase